MSQKLSADIIKSLPLPPTGNKLYRDTEVRGFAIRVTAAGDKSFVFNYRVGGRERRLTIGPYGRDLWTLTRARKRAGELRRMVDNGRDPLGEKEAVLKAPTVANLCQRFREEHLPKRRPSTQRDYDLLIKKYVLPSMRNMKVSAVESNDVEELHRKITKRGTAYTANRTVAVLSKMFSLAINKWKWRLPTDGNPCRGIEKNPEEKRERYLTASELGLFMEALTNHPDKQACNIFKLLLLTGARKSEVLKATWDQIDLQEGIWVKPASSTKQGKLHRVTLSGFARQLLFDIQEEVGEREAYVFPGRHGGAPRNNIKTAWAEICKMADLRDFRVHDLRHSHASFLASSGQSLLVIGQALGHSQPATTARYSHLLDDPQRQAAEAVASIMTGGKSAEIVKLPERG